MCPASQSVSLITPRPPLNPPVAEDVKVGPLTLKLVRDISVDVNANIDRLSGAAVWEASLDLAEFMASRPGDIYCDDGF